MVFIYPPCDADYSLLPSLPRVLSSTTILRLVVLQAEFSHHNVDRRHCIIMVMSSSLPLYFRHIYCIIGTDNSVPTERYLGRHNCNFRLTGLQRVTALDTRPASSVLRTFKRSSTFVASFGLLWLLASDFSSFELIVTTEETPRMNPMHLLCYC